MDARPQRPVRAFRAAGDENAALLPISKPTIHQRHKSTGTLSSMLAAGGLKAAAKRTAFGDISNTARVVLNAKDDSVVGKHINVDFVKPLAPTDKSTGLLRPAQRPLSAAASKAPLSVSSMPAEPASLAALERLTGLENRLATQPHKQPVAKRAPAIFKDVDADNEKPTTYSTKPNAASDPQAFNVLSQQQAVVKQESVILPEDHLKISENQIRAEVVSEAAIQSFDVLESKGPKSLNQELPASRANSDLVPTGRSVGRSLPAVPSDPAEAREHEDVESDEDLATAYSFRSRGDNTTGGATVIMAPHITIRSRQELTEAKMIVEASRTQDEVDDEAWDTSMVAEYGDEIFTYMRELESRMLPNPYYMDNQAEIQWSMRSVLMDWLIQVHHRFALLPETLFLCVNYIDRFLSCKVVSLGKLQLVGATAIFVAAKYEEINCPSVQEIVYMVDGGYTTDEILKAERYMLSMLQFELGWPGPMSFLRRISKADDYDLETRTLAKYFLEVTIMDERFVGSVPSYVAAGAHALARFMLKKGDWTAAHAYYSGYTWTQLRPLISLMMECCRNPQKHHCAVFEKYSDRRYKRASIFVRDQMDFGFVLPTCQPSYIRPSILTPPDLIDSGPYDAHKPPHESMVQLKA